MINDFAVEVPMKWLRNWKLLVSVAIVALLASTIVVVREGEQALILSDKATGIGRVYGPGVRFRIPFIQKLYRLQVPAATPSYENSLVLAPFYVEYLLDSDEKFAGEAAELKRRIGSAPYVMLGFAAGLQLEFPDNTATLHNMDKILQRARQNDLVVHVSMMSGFFHGWNDLREQAIREDVRHAQWFADGLIAPPKDLKDPAVVPHSVWTTPSRYAVPFRSQIEKNVREVGAYLARKMAQFPETLVTFSGDAEVEYSYERSFGPGAEGLTNPDIVYTDYSPFMIAEFRDDLKKNYRGDRTPNTDDDGDGHTFNRDFATDFDTWRLKYYDESGPLPYADYVRLAEKLPTTGPNFVPRGFDAPRQPQPRNAFWSAWLRFREQALANWVRDFATWITTSDGKTAVTIPPSRYYTHQIPADFLFGKPDNPRLQTSASALRTAFIDPIGSSGITAFNTFNGFRYGKTTSPALFSAIAASADHWGILEYNPSVPSSNNDGYYLAELRRLHSYRPHLIVPFVWSRLPELERYRVQDASFERSLRRFVQEVGETPWFSVRSLKNVAAAE